MKALNKKRILSATLAGVMALSMAATAFALEGDEENQTPATPPAQDPNSTVITATYEETEINVVVPQQGTASINPYGLPVNVAKSEEGEKATISGQQVVTQPLYIKSKMGMALQVDATLTGKVSGGLKLATSAEAITGKAAVGSVGDANYVAAVAPATTNSAFIYLQTKAATTAGEDDATLSDGLIDEFAGWTQAFDADKDIVLGTKAVKKENFATLAAATMDSESGEFTEYAAGSIVLYRLAGNVVEAPKTAWKADDGFEATVAFTFKPAAA